MPADSSYIWSAERSAKTATGWQATRAWLVHGTLLESEARVAPPVAGTTSPPIAQIGESHPSSALMKCESVEVVRDKGPYTWTVTAQYSIPSSGGFTTPDNPLEKPIRYRTAWESLSETWEVDVDGIPVLNGSAIPFDSDPTREERILVVTIVRNEPFYPITKAVALKDTCNLGGYTIPGLGSISEGQGLLMPIEATSEFEQGSPYVEVAYTFKLREKGWRTRLKNKSAMGYAGGKLGRFVNAAGQPVGSILIHPRGLPIDTNIKVATDPAGIVPLTAEPVPVNPVPLTYFEEGTNCWFIKFKRFSLASWTELL